MQEEAEQLIVGPAQKQGVSLIPHIPFILDIAGYYPFFIQMACSVVFEYVKQKIPIQKNIQEKIKEEFWDEAKVHFQQIWDICDDDKREVLLNLSAGKPVSRSQEYALKDLIKEGYVKMQNSRPQVFSSLFEDFILTTYGASRGIKKKRRFLFWPF